MKTIKKSICFLISAGILVSSSLTVLAANDYTGHWAQTAITELKEKEIISGDQSGNIRPDESITRAEFIKVVNKSFSFTFKAEKNFSDVDGSAWYADELLIAKHQGYITGDQYGNANPDAAVTRAEVSVILSRILSLTLTQDPLSFSDSVADWAKGYVGAMTRAGYLSGYPDGSFKANNTITRAEAFTVVSRINKALEEKAETSANEGNTSSMPTNGFSSGSGNGGGGGGSTSDNLYATKFEEDTQTVYFNKINASSYTVKLVTPELTEEYYPNYESANSQNNKIKLASYIADICMKATMPIFDLAIYLKPNSSNASYIKIDTLKMNLPGISQPVIDYRLETIDGKTNVIFEWDNVKNAKTYLVKFFVNNVENKSIAVDLTENTAVVLDSNQYTGKSISLSIIAVSDNTDLKNSSELKITPIISRVRGKGTAEDPYLISTKEDFELLRTKSKSTFVILNDIDLGDFTPISTFSGTLKGYDSERKVNLRANIVSELGIDVGIIGKLVDGTVENIVTEGSVKGYQRVGSLVGTVDGNGIIRNCINNALVTGDTSIGGIVGYSLNGKMTLENSYNLGEVSGNKNIGGIGGYLNNVVVNSCANYGAVKGASNVAGIVGAAYCSVDNSFNVGKIESTSNAGGITGTLLKGYFISNCYNLGAISTTLTSTSNIGGINGTNSGSTTILENASITNCYNSGTITGGVGAQISATATTVVISNCYYVSDSQIDSKTKNLKASELKDATNEFTKQLLKEFNNSANFEFNSTDLNDYPSCIGNPQLAPDLHLYYTLKISSVEIKDGSINLNWTQSKTPNGTAYLILTDKSNYKVSGKVTLNNSMTSCTFKNIEQNKYYGYKVIVLEPDGSKIMAFEKIIDTISAGEVTNLAANVNRIKLSISFKEPVSADYVKSYLYLNGSFTATLEKGTQSYDFGDLEEEKDYIIKLVTVDNYGNLSAGMSITAKTKIKDYLGDWLNTTDLEKPTIIIQEITE